MTRLVAALLAALNRHRRPDLPRRKAAASARTGHWPITDTQLAAVLDQWTNEQKEGK
jgi:hypothetical protein